MDPEWVKRVCDMEDLRNETLPGAAEDAPYTPLGYTEIVSRLDLVADRVLAVRTAVQASYSDKHKEPHFDPLPRPTTELAKERERRARNVLLEVDRLFTGEGLSLSFE